MADSAHSQAQPAHTRIGDAGTFYIITGTCTKCGSFVRIKTRISEKCTAIMLFQGQHCDDQDPKSTDFHMFSGEITASTYTLRREQGSEPPAIGRELGKQARKNGERGRKGLSVVK